MHIPRIWVKVEATEQTPDGRKLPVLVWGWGDDEPSAKSGATERLLRLLERIRRGDPFPNKYGYGSRPLREEILQTIESPGGGQVAAILTRNSYGAQVLNTADLLFLDVDIRPPTLLQRVSRVFGAKQNPTEETVLAKLRDALVRFGRATFRIYRTASGLRAMAIDRKFDPVGTDAQELMSATGTDPAFVQLCKAQQSFRARLTPKPWRCKSTLPPGQHPRLDETLERQFEAWLAQYERA